MTVIARLLGVGAITASITIGLWALGREVLYSPVILLVGFGV